MTTKYATILTAAMALILAGGLAVGQEYQAGNPGRTAHDGNKGHRMEHRGQRGPMEPERMVRMLSTRLDLDDEQTRQIENIMSSVKPEYDALREKGRANREAQRELDTDDPDYGAKMQNITTTSGELAATATALRGRVRAEINAILTPEQREHLANAPERERNRGQRHRGRDTEEPAVQ